MESDIGGDLKQDAVIQRFEFTYELLWKVFRKIARLKKVDCFTPRDAFSFAFKLGLLDDEGLFLEIIDARNKTSHVYSKKEAAKIYDFIINVGDILKIENSIAPMFEEADNDIKLDIAFGVAEMSMVVNSGAADEQVDCFFF